MGFLEVYGIPDLLLRRRVSNKADIRSLEWTDLGIFVGGTQRMTLHDPGSLEASTHGRVMTTRSFSHDGNFVAAVASRGDRADLIDVSNSPWQVERIFEDRKGPIRAASAALSEDGKRMIVGRGPELTVWDTATATELWRADL